MEIETYSKQKQLALLWWFFRALREMEPELVKMIEGQFYTPIRICKFPECFHICAPRSRCLPVIRDAIKHHRRARHEVIEANSKRIPPAIWPDGTLIICEIYALGHTPVVLKFFQILNFMIILFQLKMRLLKV